MTIDKKAAQVASTGTASNKTIDKRHSTAPQVTSQRAMIAAGLANLEHGQRADRARDANLHLSPVTRDQAAEMLQVSPRSVATAAMVEREAPEWPRPGFFAEEVRP